MPRLYADVCVRISWLEKLTDAFIRGNCAMTTFMQRASSLFIVWMFLFAGCNTATNPANLSYEGKWKRILEVAKEINVELESVTDKASSEKAAPRLKKLVAEYNALDAAIQNSSADSAEQMQRVAKQYMQPILTEMMATGSHAIRCKLNPHLSAASEALEALNNND